jgi:hypothetical protein
MFKGDSAAIAIGLSGVRAALQRNEVSTIFVIIGLTGVHALPLGVAAKQSVNYICDYICFFFFFYFSATYFSPKRGYRRVPKFCMGS